MDYVNHWNELFYIYKQCSRIGLLQRNGNSMWYISGMTFYAVMSFCVFWVTYESAYNLVATIFSEFTLALLVGYILSWKNGREVRECSMLPASERELYARYRMFRSDFKENSVLSNLPIKDLLEWNDARFKKIDVSSVFHNPIFILFLSTITSLVVSTEIVKSNGDFVFSLVVFFLGGVVPLLWLMQDYLHSEKRKYFNICKFLKWIEIESEVDGSKAVQNSGPGVVTDIGGKIRSFSRRKRPCGYCLR